MPNVIYNQDEYGNMYPVVIGETSEGNPVLLTEDNAQSQNWFNLASQGLNVANNAFSGRGRNNFQSSYPSGYPAQGAVASVSANSSGLGGGFKLDTTTILLIAAAAFFLLKGK